MTPQAEVRVRDAQGHAVSAYTDADGNFYVLAGTTLVAPWHAGARDATGTMLMTNVINDGNCNSCHTAAGQGRLVLP